MTSFADSCSFFLCPFLPALICFIFRSFTWPIEIKASSGQSCFFSSQRNGSCTWSICADVCTGVSANFLPNFHYTLHTVLMSKTVLFQAILFSISTQFTSIWPLDRTLPAATTPSQGGPGSNGNEGVLRIHQSSSITRTSPSDCLVLYPGHWLGGGSFPSAEMQSVYSTAPANWAINWTVSDILSTKCIYKPYVLNIYI